MRAMEISRTGLDVEWQRLQVIAQNLANVDSGRDAAGQPVRVHRLISTPKGSFDRAVKGVGEPAGIEVAGIEPVAGGVRRIYDPTDPEAGADGFISRPAIDHAGEMTLLIKTSRAYEANLTAMNIAHQMYSRALELGRQS